METCALLNHLLTVRCLRHEMFTLCRRHERGVLDPFIVVPLYASPLESPDINKRSPVLPCALPVLCFTVCPHVMCYLSLYNSNLLSILNYCIVYHGCLNENHVGFVFRSDKSCDWRLSASPPPFTSWPSNISPAVANITQAAGRPSP